ncbi:unnamed protein product [Fraxinus pennsylvanica]|uniref:Uncharacterized protein n=1 Tax=Fraxinus pennsylvanica TaxID=56036 RepID=A0AAD2E5R0_9LAMI|nr:unnamed protein product [Fraxinus pennsylvanica]
MDERIWLSVVNGWATPSSTVNNEVISTTVANWIRANLDECNWNSKALQALFMEVPPKEFKRVSMCEITKEVLDILQTTHEGTQATYELTLNKPTNDKALTLNTVRNSHKESSDSDSPNEEESECPSSRRNPDKAMNATFTDDESNSNNQSEKSTRKESGKYIVFTMRIKNGSDNGSEKAESISSGENSK